MDDEAKPDAGIDRSVLRLHDDVLQTADTVRERHFGTILDQLADRRGCDPIPNGGVG